MIQIRGIYRTQIGGIYTGQRLEVDVQDTD